MIGNKPSIYNAQSVYNQGGASGTFDIDIGGVSQTLVFPPYLQPVEYIDTSEYTTGKLNIVGSRQISSASDASQYFIKLALQANKNKWDNYYVEGLYITPGLKVGGTTSDIRFTFSKSGIANATVGGVVASISSIELNQKLFLEYDLTTRIFTIKSINGILATANGSSGALPTVDIGWYALFNNMQDSPNYIFRGKIFYSYIKKGDEVVALFVPARRKDGSNSQPYIVECVSGSVALNCSSNSNTLGIEFGPDINLSNEIPGWIT